MPAVVVQSPSIEHVSAASLALSPRASSDVAASLAASAVIALSIELIASVVIALSLASVALVASEPAAESLADESVALVTSVLAPESITAPSLLTALSGRLESICTEDSLLDPSLAASLPLGGGLQAESVSASDKTDSAQARIGDFIARPYHVDVGTLHCTYSQRPLDMTQRTLWSIRGNSQRLDGGAMFGNAPRPVWERWIAPDERNRIPLACRAMLVRELAAEDDSTEPRARWILFEAGIGAFFEPKLKDRFGVVESEHVLLRSLENVGVSPDDISAVVLSHLHFDHVGGLLSEYQEGKSPELLFSNARYVVGAEAWRRAKKPHARDRASFIPELIALLEASGRLELVEGAVSETLGDAYTLHRSDGHTPGLMLAEVPSSDGPVVFAADLIPGRPWVHLPITMGYDRYPEKLIDEKTELLTDLIARGGRLFFTHDPECAMSRVTRDGAGRFGAGESWMDPQGLAL